jgi:uncharacterized protein (DUF1330 family)
MAAYMIAQIDVHDADEYAKYLSGFMPIFQRYGGKLLATSKNRTKIIEGEWALPNTVVMEFPSIVEAEQWHADPEYQQLAIHRKKSAQANLVLGEGMDNVMT